MTMHVAVVEWRFRSMNTLRLLYFLLILRSFKNHQLKLLSHIKQQFHITHNQNHHPAISNRHVINVLLQ